MKSLPVIWPDLKEQRYACHSCTHCCRDPVVHLTAEDRAAIDRQSWVGRLPALPYVQLGASYVLNHGPDGACVFLQPDGLCRIHAEYGASAKPMACQVYPFTLERDAEGHRLGLRFDCPSVARSNGQAVASHRRAVERLAREWEQTAGSGVFVLTRPRLTPRQVLSTSEVDRLNSHLDRWVRAPGVALPYRLAGLLDLAETLEAARLNAVREERFDELIGMVVDDLPNSIRELREKQAPPPTARQLRLFRHTVVAHTEHVGFEEARAPFLRTIQYRIAQIKRARRVAAGKGLLPDLLRQSGVGTFADLDAIEPDPKAHDAVDELLTRYVRVRLATRSAFGPAYHDWDAVCGLRALVLSVAVAGWVARYLAVRKGAPLIGLDEWIGAIGRVDRTATRSPALAGRSARWRIDFLSQDSGLLRLLWRYGPSRNDRPPPPDQTVQ